MTGMRKTLILWASAASLAWLPAGTARAETAPPALDPVFAATSRGDIAPLRRALAGAEGDAAVILRAELAAARLDPAAADDPALRRIAAGADPALRRAALAVIAPVAFVNGDYAEAMRAGRELEALLSAAGEAEQAEDAGQMWRLAELLAGRPGQRVEGEVQGRTIPTRVDRVGLPRIDVAVNGLSEEAVFDTGANLSVLSASTAQRLGVTVLERSADVSNGVEGTVPVRIGIAARLEIAGTVLTNVPFLIIDDANLTFPLPGGYDIKAIVGLPVMRALGRFRVESAAGRFTVLPGAARTIGASNLIASGNNLFVEVGVDGRVMPLHLDTGANQTTLGARYAADNPDAVAALATSQVRNASAGGTRDSQLATWANAPLMLAGRVLVMPQLPVTLPAEGVRPRFYGTLGSNVLRMFDDYTIDFATMRLDLGSPIPATAGTR